MSFPPPFRNFFHAGYVVRDMAKVMDDMRDRFGVAKWKVLPLPEGSPASALGSARNNAQTLANSLEILGDAQPTQANYDEVRNSFDVNGALGQLRNAVTALNGALAH